MRKRYLFLMSLLFPLAAMMWSSPAYADDPDKSQYDAALAAVPTGSYYITTVVDGVKYYVDLSGALYERYEDLEPEDGLFTINQVSGGALYDVGWHIENVTGGHFSNTTLSDSKAVLNPRTGIFRIDGSNNRNDWESQVFFLGENGKFAIRSCNTAYGTSSWADAGRAFWTYEVEDPDEDGIETPVFTEEGGLMPAYTYEAAYIWEFEKPAEEVQYMSLLDALYNKFEEQIFDEKLEEDDGGVSMNMGNTFGKNGDWESWYALYDLLQELNTLYTYIVLDGNGIDETCPSFEELQAMEAQIEALYQKVLDSEIPYVMPQEGYYRILAHNRYKSTYDESGFVDKAIAASFDKNHENRCVFGTLKRDRANYLWKLTKSESGDSILLQNAGLGTYISNTSAAQGAVFMTEDANEASYVMFDYAYDEPQYVEPDGVGAEKDIFSIRLASEPRDGNYFHQNGHSSVGDDSSPWGNYGVDSGEEQNIGFWMRTWNANRTTDLNTSEWFLEFVPEDEAAQIIDDFEVIFNHDKLVQQNQELRDEVLETLTLAKDEIRTKMITDASQLSSPNSDSQEGTHIEYLIDNDGSTFWHTDWHGESAERMAYDGGEYHYLQISGMENMVGDCELYLKERDGADNDRVKTLVVLGTDNLKNEDEDWEEIVKITLPHTGKAEENYVPFTNETSYPFVRVIVIDTDYSNYAFRTFWHAAEIQFYTVAENPNSQFNLLGQVAQDLQDAYDTNCAIADEDLTLADYEALKAAYDTFMASGLVDPAELRNAIEKFAKATQVVVEGNNPGQWSDMTVVNEFKALYDEVLAYNKAGKYKAEEMHKYAVMLKAMQKSFMEQANGVETDKWYRIMYPTEEMFDDYGFSKEGGDKTGLVEAQGTMFGTFVVPAKEQSETSTVINDDGEEVETTITYLEPIAAADLRESDRLFFMSDEEIDANKDASKFRFVELEADPSDYAPLFMDVKENMSLAIDMFGLTYTQGEPLITSAAQFSSNASYPGNDGQKLESGCLIDNDFSTYWHSDYGRTYCAVPYLQVALNEPVSGLIQVYVGRRNTSNGHVTRMYVQGSNDAENWTNIGYIETPYTNASTPATSQAIDLGGTYSYLRFSMTQRYGTDGGSNIEFDPLAEGITADDYNTKYTYFHCSEFQIYPVTQDQVLGGSAKTLYDAYVAANKVIFSRATAEDLAAASQGYQNYRNEFNGKEGKAVLPKGIEKAPSSYAIQNKATGLYVFVDGTGNQNNIYLKTIPTLCTYKAIGYNRSLLGGRNLAGQSTNYLHAGESNRRFCTWGTTDPTTNSGLVICDTEPDVPAVTEFTFFKNVKPGRIADWCHSITLTSVDAPADASAYTALGQFTIGEDEDAETYLALKAVETIPAGEPALYVYGSLTSYDPDDDYTEPMQFRVSADEKPVLEGTTVNGLIGTLVTYTVDDCQIYFDGNGVGSPEQGTTVNVTPCSAVLDLDNCPQVEADINLYDLCICLGEVAKDVEVGVKDISSTLEKVSQAGNVYSMDGKLLRTGATLNSLKAMGKGMYILNGVKVIVK